MSATAEPRVPDDEYVSCTVSGDTRAEIVQAAHKVLLSYVMHEDALEWVIERLDVRRIVSPSYAAKPGFTADVLARVQLR